MRSRRVVAREPPAQAVQPWEEHSFVDVCLIELVANLPLERCGDDDAPTEVRVLREPVVETRRRARHEGEKRELVQDSLVDGRRFEKHDEWLSAERVEVAEGSKRRQHLDSERIRSFLQ